MTTNFTAQDAQHFAESCEADLGLGAHSATALEIIMKAIIGLDPADAAQILGLASGVVSGEFSPRYVTPLEPQDRGNGWNQ